MSWVFSVIYLLFNHLSPGDILPTLAPYHPQLWIGGLALLGLLYNLTVKSYPFRAPQNLLIIGLFAVILLSDLVHGWIGEVQAAFSIFSTSIAAFFFCVANLRQVSRIRFLAIGLVLVGLYIGGRGIVAYHFGYGAEVFIHSMQRPGEEAAAAAVPGDGRIQGLGMLRDPNDLSQFLLIDLCFVGLAWRKRAWIRNIVLVIIPSAILSYAIYRTQSRGALLGLGVVAFLPLRRRLGNTAGAIISVVGLLVLLSGGYLAQRQNGLDIKDDASTTGRIIAWGAGLGMLQSSPILGIGFGQFADRNDGLTAHNSFVLCLTELGLTGYFCWIALISCTLLDLSSVTSLVPEDVGDLDLIRWATAVQSTIIVFLVTAWFLSRTYVVTLYLLLGMAVALVHTAGHLTGIDFQTKPRLWFSHSWKLALASVILIYGMIRMHGLG